MESVLNIGVVLFIGFIIVSGIRATIYHIKLFQYLQINHTEKWKELTTFLFMSGLETNPKAIAFLFSKEGLGDPEVIRLKVKARNSIIYSVIGMVACFLWVCIMTLIIHSAQ